MPFLLTDVQKLPLAVSFVTAAGNPAVVDGKPVWASSAPELVTVEPSVDGLSAVVTSVGPLGFSQISVRADAKLGEDIEEIIGVLDIEVVPSQAANVVITAGVPEPK